MNRSSIVVQNGNIPVIPSAPSAWNLTPPDTCSFVWAGILQQDSSLAPSLSSHLPSLSASFLNVLTLARLLSFYLLLSFICLHLDTILFTFLPSFTHWNIPAFTNTLKLPLQTTSFHFFISLKYSFFPPTWHFVPLFSPPSFWSHIHPKDLHEKELPSHLKIVLQRLLYW